MHADNFSAAGLKAAPDAAPGGKAKTENLTLSGVAGQRESAAGIKVIRAPVPWAPGACVVTQLPVAGRMQRASRS